MAQIRNREFDQLPVRHSGCVKDALAVKYVSIVWRCCDGGDCVRRWMMLGISLTGNRQSIERLAPEKETDLGCPLPTKGQLLL